MGMTPTDPTNGFDRRHRTTRGSYLVLGVLIAIALVAGACGSSKSTDSTAATNPSAASDEGTPQDGGSLVVGIGAETNGWNPALAQWADTGSLVGSSIMEPLAGVDENAGAKPWLADSWIANDSFTAWVIKLHPGVKFHDGSDFDAAAVKKNIDYYKTGTLSGIALSPMIGDTVVNDPLTVTVNVKQPWAAFPNSFMTGGSSFMMAPSMIDNPTDHGASHPIGTGPFVFDSWTPDSTFKATKNVNYWRAGEPHLDSLEFRVIPDETARANALKSGDVNMIYTTRASDANDMA